MLFEILLSYAQNLIEIGLGLGPGPLQEPLVFETFDVGEIAQRRAAEHLQELLGRHIRMIFFFYRDQSANKERLRSFFRSLTARWMSQAE